MNNWIPDKREVFPEAILKGGGRWILNSRRPFLERGEDGGRSPAGLKASWIDPPATIFKCWGYKCVHHCCSFKTMV